MFRSLIVVFFFLISVTQAGERSDVVSLSPMYYSYQSFAGINLISIDAYDYNGNTISIYLNAGDVDIYDEDSSVIKCDNVKRCTVKNLRLTTGTYTLFIVNDHLFSSVKVRYDVSYWSLQAELITLLGIVVALISTCILSYGAYRICCYVKRKKTISMMYNNSEKSFAPYTELAKNDKNMVPITIELTTV
jgi:hypothetical protein